MSSRARSYPSARRVAFMAALSVFALSTSAATQASAASKVKQPSISSVRPLDAAIGDTITINGKNFRRGKGRNSVVFKRDGAPAVFVKADIATTKMIKVKLPARLAEFLRVTNGVAGPTKFRVRVLAQRLSRSYTSDAKSPMIGPEKPKPGQPGAPAPGAPGEIPKVDPDGNCDSDAQLNSVDLDDDEDLLPDTTEASLKLDPCKVDTDGDQIQDGYEYRSARDLNDDDKGSNAYLPYPSARPYPNPLDGNDAQSDFDGDALTMLEEFRLWQLTIAQGATPSLDALTYSAGEKYSVYTRDVNGHRQPTLMAAGYERQQNFLGWAATAGYDQVELQDLGDEWYEPRQSYDIRDLNRSGMLDFGESTYYDGNGDGRLSDDERDEDADGLSNFDEARGCLSGKGWWSALYDDESAYYATYGGTDLANGDTDGDTVRDGADDQDHDDIPNVMECSRQAVLNVPLDPADLTDPPLGRPAIGFMNPFNPCLPAIRSRTCNRHPDLASPWAPFNPDDKYYFIWN